MLLRNLALLSLVPTVLAAQHSPEMHAAMHGRSAALTMPGDSISGALSEVIATLDEDETTDWNRVDIDSLVRHLRQMHTLFTFAEVVSTETASGVRHEITGTPEVIAAAREMVPAHAAMVGSELGWRAEVNAGESHRLVVTIEASDEGAVARLRALGFFGFMAAGGHHQIHHLMLARGMSPHGEHGHHTNH